MRRTKWSNLVTIASKVFLSIDTISIYFIFIVIASFRCKEKGKPLQNNGFSKTGSLWHNDVAVVSGNNGCIAIIYTHPTDCRIHTIMERTIIAVFFARRNKPLAGLEISPYFYFASYSVRSKQSGKSVKPAPPFPSP